MKNEKLKEKFLLFALIYICFLILNISISSFAKYSGVINNKTSLNVAKWVIKVNNQDITSSNIFNDSIKLVSNSENVNSNKIAPLSSGYFDITIDLSGTDVGISYSIDLSNSKLPSDLVINSYKKIEDGVESDLATFSDNKVSGTKKLNSNMFTSKDIITYRFYWNYIDNSNEEQTSLALSDYSFNVNAVVTVNQIIK